MKINTTSDILSNRPMKITRINKSKIDQVDFNNLSFGKNFSDHMFVCHYKNNAWQEPYIQPYQNINLMPGSHVLHYGQAIFEGMKAYLNPLGERLLFRPEENWKRLNISAERLCMPSIPKEIFFDGLKTLLKLDEAWIPNSTKQSLYIRPFMIASSEFIRATPASEFTFYIITSPTAAYYAGETHLKIEEHYARSVKGGTGFAKAAGNYAAAFAPTKKAQEEGYTQVIWTDAIEHKYIEESGTMNIMFRIHDKLITPQLSDSILGGITRKSIITLAKDRGIHVEERRIAVNEITEAHQNDSLKEVFGIGTAVAINPVNSITIQQKKLVFNTLDDSSFALSLKKELLEIQYGLIKDVHDWTVKA